MAGVSVLARLPSSCLLLNVLWQTLTVSALGGCTAQAPFYEAGGGRWGDRGLVDVVGIPVAWLRRDREPGRPPFDDLSGPGVGVRAAIGNADQSVGVLYQGIDLGKNNDDANLHATYLDFDVSVPLNAAPNIFFVNAGAGVGMAWLDLGQGQETTGAANLRLQLEVRPVQRVSVFAGLGGFAFGHPGESDAFGSFLTLGGRVTF